jgi:hypothetical protein
MYITHCTVGTSYTYPNFCADLARVLLPQHLCNWNKKRLPRAQKSLLKLDTSAARGRRDHNAGVSLEELFFTRPFVSHEFSFIAISDEPFRDESFSPMPTQD